MTEVDATMRPLKMSEKFIPYLDNNRIYRMFKNILTDLIVILPKDHLKHIKTFLNHHIDSTKDLTNLFLLISPQLEIDTIRLVKELIRNLGLILIERKVVFDKMEKDDDFVPGSCISEAMLSKVTQGLVRMDYVRSAGWLMFDHPCTVRGARYFQQDGILPTCTLTLVPPKSVTPATVNHYTPPRNYFQQDFEGLKYIYRATIKEVEIDTEKDSMSRIVQKCLNGIRAMHSGSQGPLQGQFVVGSPSVYRVVLIGPSGAGCKTQAELLSDHFRLVYIHFERLMMEAAVKPDKIGEYIRDRGITRDVRLEVLSRRLLQKDCIDYGWVLTHFPASALELESMDQLATPPNRLIFIDVDKSTCTKRLLSHTVDWCTGKQVRYGSSPRGVPYYRKVEQIDNELETYFSETLAELRATAGITAEEVNGLGTPEEVAVRLQAAVINSPIFDIQLCSTNIKYPHNPLSSNTALAKTY